MELASTVLLRTKKVVLSQVYKTDYTSVTQLLLVVVTSLVQLLTMLELSLLVAVH